MMLINGADTTGWLDETGVVQAHILTAHAAIASLAIIALFIFVAQLLPRSGSVNDDDH